MRSSHCSINNLFSVVQTNPPLSMSEMTYSIIQTPIAPVTCFKLSNTSTMWVKYAICRALALNQPNSQTQSLGCILNC